MAKRKSFEEAFLDIDNDVNNNIDTSINNIMSDLSMNNNKNIPIISPSANLNTNPTIPLNDYVQQKVKELENKIRVDLKRRLNYSDKYIGITISIRPALQALIKEIKDKTILDKYEIIELLLMTGLKNIDLSEYEGVTV
jgi:hypothetical protein